MARITSYDTKICIIKAWLYTYPVNDSKILIEQVLHMAFGKEKTP